MPLPFGLPVGLLLGLALGWIARHEVGRAEAPLLLLRPFAIVLGFAVLIFAPALGYFVAMHDDWAYMYLVQAARIPSAIDFVFVVLVSASIPVGFALGTAMTNARRFVLLRRLAAALLILTVLGTLAMSRRLGVSATTVQYRAGFGLTPIGQSSLGRGLLLSWVSLGAAFAWTVQVFRIPGRRRT